jgi:ABC-type nickel/cobalt efflux system permease component RcnA
MSQAGERAEESSVRGRAHALKYLRKGLIMSPLLVVVLIIAVILLITGGFVQSLNFLLWVGLVLLAIAVIAFLIRAISGRR